jgi:hypothetical protein
MTHHVHDTSNRNTTIMLSAVLIVVGMGNPQVLFFISIPIPVKTRTCTGTHKYGFLWVLTLVSRGQWVQHHLCHAMEGEGDREE